MDLFQKSKLRNDMATVCSLNVLNENIRKICKSIPARPYLSMNHGQMQKLFKNCIHNLFIPDFW